MRQTLEAIKRNGVFFIGYLLISLAAILLLVKYGKAESFLLLNTFHSAWIDQFFIYFTFLGDGLFALLICAVYFFLLKKRKEGFTLLLAYASSGLIAQLIKRFVVAPRPKSFFLPGQYHFFIEDITHSANNSFPSGHATTAFAMAAAIILLINNTKWQLPVLLLATLVAYSRVYLAQHFLLDILTGSIIGIACAVICVHTTRNLQQNKLVWKKDSKMNR